MKSDSVFLRLNLTRSEYAELVEHARQAQRPVDKKTIEYWAATILTLLVKQELKESKASSSASAS